MQELEFHPLANLFPLLEEKELQSLADDITANGQQELIVLFEGKILDGRNRYRACKLAGVEPIMEEYKGSNPQQFVVSLNLHRRHLTDGQRTVIASLLTNAPSSGAAKHSDEYITTQKAADMMRVNAGTLKRVSSFIKSATEEEKQELLSGKIKPDTFVRLKKGESKVGKVDIASPAEPSPSWVAPEVAGETPAEQPSTDGSDAGKSSLEGNAFYGGNLSAPVTVSEKVIRHFRAWCNDQAKNRGITVKEVRQYIREHLSPTN